MRLGLFQGCYLQRVLFILHPSCCQPCVYIHMLFHVHSSPPCRINTHALFTPRSPSSCDCRASDLRVSCTVRSCCNNVHPGPQPTSLHTRIGGSVRSSRSGSYYTICLGIPVLARKYMSGGLLLLSPRIPEPWADSTSIMSELVHRLNVLFLLLQIRTNSYLCCEFHAGICQTYLCFLKTHQSSLARPIPMPAADNYAAESVPKVSSCHFRPSLASPPAFESQRSRRLCKPFRGWECSLFILRDCDHDLAPGSLARNAFISLETAAVSTLKQQFR